LGKLGRIWLILKNQAIDYLKRAIFGKGLKLFPFRWWVTTLAKGSWGHLPSKNLRGV